VDSIRSIVWIGDERLAVALAADCPTLEVVWERDVAGASALPLEDFDVLMLACENSKQALEALADLSHRHRVPPIFVQLESVDDLALRELHERGATDVFCYGAEVTAQRLKRALLQGLAKFDPPAKPAVASKTRRSIRPPNTKIIGASPQIAEVLELIAVNCAAFPEALLESELFGHKKGSFTGADRDKSGLFEAANGGTLFLDEIGETTSPFQAKLLRVLQEREVRPIGSSRTRKVDVRVIAATNRNLRREASDAQFRPDLYYRLAVFPIHVPPLRERPIDILPLADHFLARYATREGRPNSTLSAESRHLLQSYSWPGNVRELENEIQRALAVAEPCSELTPAQFSARLFDLLEPVHAVVQPGESLRETLARVEAWLIRRALDANSGRRATTARLLGITREGLYKKMKRHGIT